MAVCGMICSYCGEEVPTPNPHAISGVVKIVWSCKPCDWFGKWIEMRNERDSARAELAAEAAAMRGPLSKLMCQLAWAKDSPDTWEHAFYHEADRALAVHAGSALLARVQTLTAALVRTKAQRDDAELGSEERDEAVDELNTLKVRVKAIYKQAVTVDKSKGREVISCALCLATGYVETHYDYCTLKGVNA